MSKATTYKGQKIETVGRDDLIKHLHSFFESPQAESFSKLKMTKIMIGDILDEIGVFIHTSLEEKNVKLFDLRLYQYIQSSRSARTQTVPGQDAPVRISATPEQIKIKCKCSIKTPEKISTRDFKSDSKQKKSKSKSK